MSETSRRALNWVEQGYVPDGVVRAGIRRLLRERLGEIAAHDADRAVAEAERFIEALRTEPIALVPAKANEQHYEVPQAFFGLCLGPHRKYSSCFWPDGTASLRAAEAEALAVTCARAELMNGQDVLELGCGWGSLTLWMAAKYPASRITAVSNSNSQREYILAQAAQRGLTNVDVITADMNVFSIEKTFDRVVSVEMFEHMRNWPTLFARVRSWMRPGARFFMHVFAHRSVPYAFIERDPSDWMSRFFFSGGMMPSEDLAPRFQDDLRLLRRWRWNGQHYERTANAWLRNLDDKREEALQILAGVHGSEAGLWLQRWRIFFMSCAELFGYDGGEEWAVMHYLFERAGHE